MLDFCAEGVVFAIWGGGGGDGLVEFLLGGGVDVGEEVGKVGGGLEIYFAVVGVHCLWLKGCLGGLLVEPVRLRRAGGQCSNTAVDLLSRRIKAWRMVDVDSGAGSDC